MPKGVPFGPVEGHALIADKLVRSGQDSGDSCWTTIGHCECGEAYEFHSRSSLELAKNGLRTRHTAHLKELPT
jgi:hypothetical protein